MVDQMQPLLPYRPSGIFFSTSELRDRAETYGVRNVSSGKAGCSSNLPRPSPCPWLLAPSLARTLNTLGVPGGQSWMWLTALRRWVTGMSTPSLLISSPLLSSLFSGNVKVMNHWNGALSFRQPKVLAGASLPSSVIWVSWIKDTFCSTVLWSKSSMPKARYLILTFLWSIMEVCEQSERGDGVLLVQDSYLVYPHPSRVESTSKERVTVRPGSRFFEGWWPLSIAPALSLPDSGLSHFWLSFIIFRIWATSLFSLLDFSATISFLELNPRTLAHLLWNFVHGKKFQRASLVAQW